MNIGNNKGSFRRIDENHEIAYATDGESHEFKIKCLAKDIKSGNYQINLVEAILK